MSAPALRVTLLALLIVIVNQIAYALPAEANDSPVFVPDLSVDSNGSPLVLPGSSAKLSGNPNVLPAADPANHWVETWTASVEAVTLGQSPVTFQDTTIRQTVPLSVGSQQVALTVSNVFGMSDLIINRITMAIPLAENGRLSGSRSIDTTTLHSVTFNGASLVSIPQGGQAVSDPVTFDSTLPAGQVLSVSMYLSSGQTGSTISAHIYSRTKTGTIQGDQTSAMSIPGNGRGNQGLSWYFISSVKAWSDPSTKALVVIGDSITDRRSSPINRNYDWPTMLSARVHATSGFERISIVNQGSGGNNVLRPSQGPTVYQEGALMRLNRDALSLDGVGYVMIFEGIDDLGNSDPSQAGQADIQTRLIQAYQQMISQIHTSGYKAIGATLTPFLCPPGHTGGMNRYALEPIREQTRQNINSWIRTSGSFDYVVDFDKILRDRKNPAFFSQRYIGTDCLHPSLKGYAAMARLFPLEVFLV